MKHFSHPHDLQLQGLVISPTLLPPICSCCQLPPSGYDDPMYVCMACNFFLHLSCAHYPHLITHPSHMNHTLTFLPSAAYPGGAFNCDGCNLRGIGFSYHCSSCEYDLHAACASKPLQIALPSHSCTLELCFANPYGNAKGFSCDVCHKIGLKEWLYRCAACDYDVHMNCAAQAAVRGSQAHYDQFQSTPVVSSGPSGQPQPQHQLRYGANLPAGPQFLPEMTPSFVHGARFGQGSSIIPGHVEDGSTGFSPDMVQELIGGYISGRGEGGGTGSDGDGLGAVFGDSSGSAQN